MIAWTVRKVNPDVRLKRKRNYIITISKSNPFKTISAAAEIAQPGDVITVPKGNKATAFYRVSTESIP